MGLFRLSKLFRRAVATEAPPPDNSRVQQAAPPDNLRAAINPQQIRDECNVILGQAVWESQVTASNRSSVVAYVSKWQSQLCPENTEWPNSPGCDAYRNVVPLLPIVMQNIIELERSRQTDDERAWLILYNTAAIAFHKYLFALEGIIQNATLAHHIRSYLLTDFNIATMFVRGMRRHNITWNGGSAHHHKRRPYVARRQSRRYRRHRRVKR